MEAASALDAYLNGLNVATLPYLCPCCVIPFTASSINWNDQFADDIQRSDKRRLPEW